MTEDILSEPKQFYITRTAEWYPTESTDTDSDMVQYLDNANVIRFDYVVEKRKTGSSENG